MDLNSFLMENIRDVDISEPAAMDMLLVRLEEISQENEEYMEVRFKYLLNIFIFILKHECALLVYK